MPDQTPHRDPAARGGRTELPDRWTAHVRAVTVEPAEGYAVEDVMGDAWYRELHFTETLGRWHLIEAPMVYFTWLDLVAFHGPLFPVGTRSALLEITRHEAAVSQS